MSSSSARDPTHQKSNANLPKNSRPKKVTMYDDLRHSLRKVNKIELECPRYIE
jgi:hypothetical protein